MQTAPFLNKVRTCAVGIAQAKLVLLNIRVTSGSRTKRPSRWNRTNAFRRPTVLVLFVFLTFFGFPFLAPAAQVTAKLDRNTITLGETVTLSISFDGVASASQPDLPSIPNFQVVGTRQSTELDPIRRIMRQTYAYELAPRQVGVFRIPAFQVRAGSQTYTTQPLQVKVLKPGSAIPNPATGAPAVFLKLVVPKTQVYLGEMLPVEVQLYAQEGRLLEPPTIPGEGFTFGKMPQQTQTQTVYRNQRYALVTFKVAAVPVKTGTLTLGPATMPLQVTDTSRPPDFFGFRAQRRIALATDPVTVQVLPLPAQNVPPSFSGAVGRYTLQVSAGPTNVAVGDPVTVKVQISGRGQLDGLSLPTQAEWREFKTYPPESKVTTTDDLGMTGVKTFEQVVIPQNHEIKVLPPFAFSYFDPDQRTYRTLHGPAIPLTVRPAAAAGPVPTLAGATNQAEPAEQPPDLARIKVHLGELSPVEVPLFRRGWFLALQLLPPALWLSLLGKRKYGESLSRNPRLRRQRQVAQTVREGLPQLRQFAAANQADEFFMTLFRLLQEQIGERLDAPASAITEAVVEERLRPRGLAPEKLTALHDLFQECNLARYASARSSQELSALIPKLEDVLQALREMPIAQATGKRVEVSV